MNYIEDEVGTDRSDDPQTIEDLAAFANEWNNAAFQNWYRRIASSKEVFSGQGEKTEDDTRRQVKSLIERLPDTEVMKIRVASHPSVYV